LSPSDCQRLNSKAETVTYDEGRSTRWYVNLPPAAGERLHRDRERAEAPTAEASGAHHHVARLEIAMGDLFLVRGCQRIGQRQRELEEAGDRQPSRGISSSSGGGPR
jgi:hypothetical protein